jgi:cellulose synthase/poly-beta-1,6-N-acetylglucosamine synthase-like glycosyltransferase
LIPAYNEERVIGKTLKRLLSSDYPKNKLDVLVINDGSSDKTSEVIRRFSGVRVLNLAENVGKPVALNKGIENAKGDIIVTTDADTKFEKNTLRNLVRHFSDRSVGAVAGYYKVDRTSSFKTALSNLLHFKLLEFSHYFLEKFQSLEYLTFLFTRKRQEVFDAVMVVPGSVGAFRKSAIKEIGGFDDKMLVEDYELTIRMHKAGYKIKCDKEALSWTNAPLTWKQFLKQRARWNRGGLQVLNKHSDILSRRYGPFCYVFGMEYVNVILQLIAWPVIVSGIAYKFMLFRLNLISMVKSWIENMLLLRFTLFDALFFMALLLSVIGFAEAFVSVKMTKDSKKKLLLYPFMSIYCMILGYAWFWSFFSHIFGRKLHTKGIGWKSC